MNFSGCRTAKAFTDVQNWDLAVPEIQRAQNAGATAIKVLLTPAPEFQFAILQRVAGGWHVAARIRAFLAIAPLTILARVY